MRITPVLLLVAALAAASSHASAQTSAAPALPSAAPQVHLGEIDFGGRFSSVSGDAARFQRLRDLRDGATLDRVRYMRDSNAWRVDAAVDHAGYRDQHYSVGVTEYGRLKASVDWNQVPLFYSAAAQTPYRTEAPGVLRLNDTRQAAVQGGTPLPIAFASEVAPFVLRSRRDVADLRFAYAATPALDLKVSLTSTGRTGDQPWGGAFGQSVPVEIAAPVDSRTNDVNATAEWSTPRALARLAYDGSWFNNHAETLVFDNPVRATDAVGGTSQGRMGLWPDSRAHTVSATGSVGLPARTRALAFVSVGSWLQDAQLLPFTVNPALPTLSLPRASAQAEARIVSMTYRLTSRPTRTLWLNAQVRRYDYDNRTPRFPVTQYVQYDTNVATSATGGSEPFGYTRDYIDLDASYTPFRYVAFRGGYGREADDRTFRYLERTTEQTVRGSIDSTGLAWGSIRMQYDHSVRTGKGLDEEAFSDIGEQVSLRQFDISDRTRDRVTAIAQVVPFDTLGLNASVGIGRERRPDVAFGLQDNNVRSATFGADYAPVDAVTMGLSLGLERYATLQRSRQANPGVQFADPTRDWSTDMGESVRTLTGTLELPKLTDRTALRFAYDNVWSRATYDYVLPSGSTLVTPVPLAPVRNQIQRATADLRQTLARRVALGIGYAWDRYSVDDFSRSPGTLNSPLFTTLIDLMYQLRAYEAHTGSVRLIYSW